MKKFKNLLLILLIIPCLFLLNGCSFFQTKAYIIEIQKTATVGNTSTYTIYFSDGTKSVLTIDNGKDGEDGEDVTIQAVYEVYLDKNPGTSFDEFLKEYMTVVQIKEEAATVENATNTAIQSTVSIFCEFPTSDYRGTNKDVSIGCGAGIIYKMEETYSYIVTNYHVVYADCDTADNIAQEITIFQYGTSETCYRVVQENDFGGTDIVYDENNYPKISYGYGAISATYVGGEMYKDIAIVKVETRELLKYNPNAKAVTIANDYSLGSNAIAIGNPEGDGTSVTSGIVSVISENLTMTGADEKTEITFRVMRIDTAINGGNSGGGLFNIKGELIGIVNAKIVSNKIDNIAYALPYDAVVPVVENLLYNYDGTSTSVVKRVQFGFSYSIENQHAEYDDQNHTTSLYNDLTIQEIEKNSLAEKIRLQVKDIIKSVSINDKVYEINQAHQFGDVILNIRPNDKIIIRVKREGVNELQACALADEEGISNTYFITFAELNA